MDLQSRDEKSQLPWMVIKPQDVPLFLFGHLLDNYKLQPDVCRRRETTYLELMFTEVTVRASATRLS